MRTLLKNPAIFIVCLLLVGCDHVDSLYQADQVASDPNLMASHKEVWGPSKKNIQDAQMHVAQMSLEQKVGHIIVGTYTGVDPAPVIEHIKSIHLGGVIVMDDNITTDTKGHLNPQAIADVNMAYHAAARADGRPYGQLIGVDQEGGPVARLKSPSTLWPAPMAYGASGSSEVVKQAHAGIATEAAAMGFTVVFAPVADLTIGALDPAINLRSMTSDVELGVQMVPAAMQGILNAGVLPSVKHFPGHGSVTADSHMVLPVQNSSIEQLKKRDWATFKSAIDAGAPLIMMGHLNVPALEKDVPSSLSSYAYQALRDLGFHGVIVTDALNMGGVKNHSETEDSAVKALQAGADLLLMPVDSFQAHQAIIQAIKEARLPLARLNDAVTKVVAMMLWHSERVTTSSDIKAVGSLENVAYQVSAAGLTVVQGPCQEDQLKGEVNIIGGSEEDQQMAIQAAKEAGLSVGRGPTLALDSGEGGARADMVAATDTPWHLGTTDVATKTKVSMYGHNPGAFKALFQYLTGKYQARGVLPVEVKGINSQSRCH